MAELAGKVVIVTGASRGIGAAAAEALAAAGAAVMLAARDGRAGRRGGRQDRSGRRQGRSAGLRCRRLCRGRGAGRRDHATLRPPRHPDQQRRRHRTDRHHRNSPIPPPGRATSQINLVGAFNAVRAVLPGMIAAGGGTIVNVSSGAALRPLEGWSAYCAGKAGMADADPGDQAGGRRQRHPRVRLPARHHRHRHAGADPRLRHQHRSARSRAPT